MPAASPKTGRIPCVVPFCRCSAAIADHPGCTEIICRACGARVKDARRAYRRAQKRDHAAWAKAWASNEPIDYVDANRTLRAAARLWEAFKRRATAAKLKAMGAGL